VILARLRCPPPAGVIDLSGGIEKANELNINSLTKRFGEHVAVDNCPLLSVRGKCSGFLGPNGAGKSTKPWKSSTGLSDARRRLRLGVGFDIAEHRPMQAQSRWAICLRARPAMATCGVKGSSNLSLSTWLRGAEKHKRVEWAGPSNWSWKGVMGGKALKPVQGLSKRRVGLAQAILLHDPRY